jgi:hypothetical protein
MTRTLVIGDVHGCAAELEALLHACELDAGDRVVLVGDLLTKGPDPFGVLELMRRIGAEATCGNHDAHLLRWKAANSADDDSRWLPWRSATGQQPPWLGPSGSAFVPRLSDADWELLAGLPLFLRLPEHGAAVVHAGVDPRLPLEQQQRDVLLNVRTIGADGTPSKKPDAGPLWGELYDGPELILFGHHARRGLQQHAHAIGLDTGCVYGGELSACLLPERRIVSVPAARVYEEAGR